MSNKVTWKTIFEDFKQRHPTLSKKVADYRPHDYLTIKIWLNDGMTITYCYLNHKATILGVNWIEEQNEKLKGDDINGMDI